MKRIFSCLLLSCATSFAAHAEVPAVGKALPALNIADRGEISLEAGDTAYKAWSSEALKGKVQIVEHTAARAGVEDLNSAFYEALEAAGLPGEEVGVTYIINADDALWGTSGLVPGEVEKYKKADPASTFVVDSDGTAQQTWDLEKKSAALILLDADAGVIYFRQGGVDESEAAEALKVLQARLAAK